MSKKSNFEQAILLDEDNFSMILQRISEFDQYETEYYSDEVGFSKRNGLLRIDKIEPEILINLLSMLQIKQVEPFLKITTAQASSLVPVIKLWHVNKEGESLRINFKDYYEEQSIQTRKYFAESTKQNQNNKEFEKFLNETSSSGVGITSLGLKQRNETPGDVNLQCDITLHFDDIVSLMQGSHKELFRVPPTINDSNPIDFRLKLLIGWAVPNIQDSYFPEELRKAIEKTQQMYMLALVEHKLTFNENGSITLELMYQGALENIFYSPDSDILSIDKILYVPGSDISKETAKFGSNSSFNLEEKKKLSTTADFYSWMKDIQKFLINRIKELQLEGKDENRDTSVDKDKNKDIKELSDALDNINGEISKIKEDIKKERYSFILDKILSNNRLYKIIVDKDSYTYSFNLTPEIIIKQLDPKNLITTNPFAIMTSAQLKIDKNVYTTSGFPKGSDIKFVTSNSREIRALSDNVITSIKKGEVLNNEQVLTNDATTETTNFFVANAAIDYQTTFPPSSDKKIIHFIMLGDIIRAASQFLDSEDANHIILGPIRFNREKIINIADVPIPLESFSRWFVQKATSKDKDKWYFKEFIKDIINQLVGPYMLGTYDQKGQRIQFNLEVETFHSPNIIEKGSRISTEEIKGFLTNSFYNREESNVNVYYLVYSTNNSLINLNGDYFEDTDRGIYHFKVGANAGILKSVTFDKIDNNKLRTARMANNALNQEGEFLREHYNCVVTMIGNHLFQAGKLFYIDGSYLGILGMKTSHLIGLGGYYMATEVNHTLAAGKFDTTVKGFWQDMGTGKGTVGSLSQKSGDSK